VICSISVDEYADDLHVEGMSEAPLDRAVKAAGGVDALATQLGVSRRTIFSWKSSGVPAASLGRVVEITDVPAAELRPDLARLFQAAARESA